MAYILPQVLVYQELTTVPQAAIAPLRAFVFGPNFDLKMYPTDKVGLGAYDPAADKSVAWPDRPVGGIVDQAWTRVFMEDAWLQYWTNPSQIRKVVGSNNKIVATSVNFVSYGSWARGASLNSRDVKLGDGVRVRGGGSSVETYVTGFEHTPVASSVGSSAADVDNQANTVAAAAVNQTAGTVNNVSATVDGSSYDGMAAGYVEETYTVTVDTASTGGDATTARLRVTSASGTDDALDVVPAAFAAATDIGSRGLTLTFDVSSADDFVVGQKWVATVRQTYTATVSTSAGSFNGPLDTTYIVTVVEGGSLTASPKITVSSTTGVDAGGPYTVTGSAVQTGIGNYGTKIVFTGGTGLVKGDRFLIPVVAEKAGAIQTLVLANVLPSVMNAIDLAVDLYIRKNMEVTRNRIGYAPLVNFETTETQITTKAGVVGYDSSWYNNTGTLLAMPVYRGGMYVQYRSLLQTYATKIGTISTVGDVVTTLGPVTRDNPLALGVFKALSNSNGTDVKFMAVPSNDFAGYSYVLEQAVGRNDVYSFVPLTWDRQVQDLVEGHILGMSSAENGRWRGAFVNSEAVEEVGVVTVDGSGSPALATIVDPLAGSNYTTVEWAGGTFLTNGVKAGDIFRCNYQTDGFGNWQYEEYPVDAVVSEDSLTLYSGPSAAVNVASKFEIWHNNSKDEVATAYGRISGSFASRRVKHVWPDWITSAGTAMEGFYLCSALAGLRSGVAPQQGLTNVELVGFDNVERSTDYFGGNQLNIMAAAGTWIVTQDSDTGQVFTRQQLTTADYAELNLREDSITTNVDSISYYLLAAFAPYIGKANVSPSFIAQLQTDLAANLDELKVEYNPRLGPQIISYDIVEFRQHTVLKDRIVATVDCVVPYPFNNFEIHLVI